MLIHSVRTLVANGVRRPSAGVIVAAIALALSVTGTAAAAVVITSNSQVSANTISGHHPPSGKHANIIAGSLTDADLAHLPAWHLVHPHGGAAPAFGCADPELGQCFMNSTYFDDLPSVAFYKWHGVVHLRGNVCVHGSLPSCRGALHQDTDAVIFTLPTGYRPKHTPMF